jgi:hypothetical protein
MIALALGEAEQRKIATRVTVEHVLKPLAKWLGPPNAYVRATEILMLLMGFILYTRQLPILPAGKGVDKNLAKWFAKSMQAIVEQSNAQSND